MQNNHFKQCEEVTHLLLWEGAEQLSANIQISRLDGAEDGRAATGIQAHAHFLSTLLQQGPHHLRSTRF